MDKRNFSVIYITNDRLEFYSSYLSSVLTYYFSADIISDLEVKNENALAEKIQIFIERNKLIPGKLIIVFSELASFEKEFSKKESGQIDLKIQDYLESVPFEKVIYKIYQYQNTTKVIVINGHFFESFKNAFISQGFTVWSVVTLTLLGEKFKDKVLDRKLFEELVEKSDFLKNESLVSEELITQSSSLSASLMTKRTFVLIVIFIVLLIILIVVLLINR